MDSKLELIEEMKLMLKVFDGCIKIGILPEPDSPLNKKLLEIIGRAEQETSNRLEV